MDVDPLAATHETVQHSSNADDEDKEPPFYFESDHLALKGNKDYQNLLRTLAVLESQRTQAIQDLDMLVQCRETALANPIDFVNKLQHKVALGLPTPQSVARLPCIQWENYTSGLGPLAGTHKHMTRNKKEPADGDNIWGNGGPTPSDATPSTSTSTQICTSSSSSVIRGRVRGERKPETFNKLWTADEQRRLEDLLLKFRPEEVEMKRFSKIAQALGNRTAQQVASRVQKYFIKLAKAGLPIPGRMPNLSQYMGRRALHHRHQRNNRFLFAPSTFMTSHIPPVYMSDDEDDSSQSQGGGSEAYDMELFQEDLEVSDEEDIPKELRSSTEYMEILRLKQLKKQKQHEESGAVQHQGYKCDGCQCEPIVGTRWHCMDCPQDVSMDLCDICVDCMLETPTHTSSHQMRPVRHAPSLPHIDRDYTMFMPGEYNYLDSNYMPAT